MSTALAIAGVTAVLKDLLNDGLINQDITGILHDNVKVSAVAPDIVLNNINLAQPQINIYMYLVSPNVAWRNESFPSNNSSGQRINNPPLALNLHYLLTAYGIEDLQAEILLGYAMQLMHENPVFNRAAINVALNPPAPLDVGEGLPPTLRALSTSGLADQFEQIKFTPEYFTTEEMSKLWSAAQSNYRPTAAYEATVVLIEADEPVRSPLPIRQRTINTITLQRPNIDEVSPDRIEVGAVLTLTGQNLMGETTQLRFGDILVDPDPANVRNQNINLTIPNSLTAGIQGVQVVHGINIGIPPTPHRGTDSNVFPFVLLPEIVTNPLPSVVAGATLTLDIVPPVLQRQRVSIMLGEKEVKIASRPDTNPPTPSTTQLNFPIPETFVADSYLLRLRIDGAESLLTTDGAGLYNGPMVTVTSP